MKINELLVRVLAFRELERDVVMKYEEESIEKKKDILLTLWSKIKERITSECLEFDQDPTVHDLSRVCKSLMIYSAIYADLINPEAKKLEGYIEQFKQKRVIPILKYECKEIIHREVFGEKKVPKRRIECKHYKGNIADIHPILYEESKKYFIEKVGRKMPSLVISKEMSKIVEEVVKEDLDKILEVSLRNACRAVAYGYMPEEPEKVYKSVLKDVKESIDWMVEQGIIEEEIIPKIKKD